MTAFTIEKTWSFAAAHHLPSLPETHKCHRPHGHNYTVTLTLGADRLDAHGFVLDYGELKPFGDWLAATFDHRDLNEIVPFQPTAESLARFCFEQARTLFGQLVSGVRVSETPNTTAEYRA